MHERPGKCHRGEKGGDRDGTRLRFHNDYQIEMVRLRKWPPLVTKVENSGRCLRISSNSSDAENEKPGMAYLQVSIPRMSYEESARRHQYTSAEILRKP